jgi:hypothetical protein
MRSSKRSTAESLVRAMTVVASGEPPPGVTDAVSGGRALLTLVCYVAVFIAVSAFAVRRREVV